MKIGQLVKRGSRRRSVDKPLFGYVCDEDEAGFC